MTVPVLSHFVGFLPVWFWTATCVPCFSSGCCFVYIASLVPSELRQLASARSRSSWRRDHSWLGLYLWGSTGRKSLSCLLNTICAGDRRRSVSGVFLYCIRALIRPSRFSDFVLDFFDTGCKGGNVVW